MISSCVVICIFNAIVGIIGIEPLVQNINYVKKGTAADQAGLQVGDQLLQVDDKPIFGWGDLKTAAVDHPGKKLDFHVLRKGQEIVIALTPEPKEIEDG